jgi:hypothetical protein
LRSLVAAHIAAMKDEELVYKGLHGSRGRLLGALQASSS